MIQVQDVHKSFGEVQALRGVSFEADDGKITGLLGPNGAGKTTLLRILYTILDPDRGSAHIDGHDVARHKLQTARVVGALPHAHGLYARLTAREHVRYFGRLHGLAGDELEQRINELVQTLDMENIADRRTGGFSQGEGVKVAIARALVHAPQNVLLDEPTTGLDVMSTRKMREMIRRLRDQGRCILFSSHLMHEVSELCDHIVVIARGTIAACGSPDELLRATGCDDLEDAFVAAIGSDEGLMR